MKHCFLLLLLFAVTSMLSGQEAVKKRYFASQVTTEIAIDGAFEEEAWKMAKWENGFVQHEPFEN